MKKLDLQTALSEWLHARMSEPKRSIDAPSIGDMAEQAWVGVLVEFKKVIEGRITLRNSDYSHAKSHDERDFLRAKVDELCVLNYLINDMILSGWMELPHKSFEQFIEAHR